MRAAGEDETVGIKFDYSPKIMTMMELKMMQAHDAAERGRAAWRADRDAGAQCSTGKAQHPCSQISGVSQIAGDGEVPRLCAKPLARVWTAVLSRVSFWCVLGAGAQRARTQRLRGRWPAGRRRFDLDAQRPWQRCGGCARGCVGRAEADLPHRRSGQHQQPSVIRNAGCAVH